MPRTPVHIVAGFLGVGKTTVLLSELREREGRERCAVIVNDFGDAQIDATLLGGGVRVSSIAGGCVCCTAPEGLVPAVSAILDELHPDRIFIEPSGLARPRDLVDMLRRGPVASRVEFGPTVVLVDPTRAPSDPHLFAEQLDGADVLAATRCDLADVDQLAAFEAMAARLWPPPVAVLRASRGRLPSAAWGWPEGAGPRAAGGRGAAHDHRHAHADAGSVDAHAPGASAPSTAGYAARSWVFPPEAVFAWDALRSLVAGTPGIERFKGVFRADVGWYRLDIAGGRVGTAITAYRRDSRADLIAREGFDFGAFEASLFAARLPDHAPNPFEGEVVSVIDPAGIEIPLSRGALMSMPGQVRDVSMLVPGKKGSGVRLAEVLSLAGPGQSFVVVANDGMTTAPAQMADLGDTVLVHSLDGGPLPDGQGGPFRIYAAGGSACANVKGVLRIRVMSE